MSTPSTVRRRIRHNDVAKEGEGVLVTSFGDTQSLKVGNVRIHLDLIKVSGNDGGERDIRVIIIGDKNIPVKRIPR